MDFFPCGFFLPGGFFPLGDPSLKIKFYYYYAYTIMLVVCAVVVCALTFGVLCCCLPSLVVCAVVVCALTFGVLCCRLPKVWLFVDGMCMCMIREVYRTATRPVRGAGAARLMMELN